MSIQPTKQCALERVAGIEPASSAWKAEVLPLNYTRATVSVYSKPPMRPHRSLKSRLEEASTSDEMQRRILVVGEGFEPSKAKPSDLQSDPFDHSGTPPDFDTGNHPLRPRRMHDHPAHLPSCQGAKARNATSTGCSAAPAVTRPQPPLKPKSCRRLWCRHKELNPGPSHYK